MPSDEVPAYLTRARALVLPSICYEGAPRTVVEAYAAGVPVVANRYGALPSVVSDGVSGLLVEPESADGWRAALASVLDDSTSQRLGEGAYAAWRTGYSPEQGIADLEAAYDAVTANSRSRRSLRSGERLEGTGGRRA